jgi:hypothetical protein
MAEVEIIEATEVAPSSTHQFLIRS